jgi:hypothetical protein
MDRRLKFYGLNDYGTFFQVKRAAECLDDYDSNKTDYAIDDIIELYNTVQFAENGIFPKDLSAEKEASYKALIPKIKKTIAIFFNAIDQSNIATRITRIDNNYHQNLLTLIVGNKVHERVTAGDLLPLLCNVGIRIDDMLENKELVKAFDQDIRLLLIAEARNAELVMCKHLEKKDRREIHLPTSLTNDDIQALLDRYIDDAEANPNYIKLIADTSSKSIGMSAKLKLKAKRKDKEWTEKFFNNNNSGGLKYGTDVAIDNKQAEPLLVSTNKEGIIRLSYGKNWLEEHLSNEEVLANFVHLFGFVHEGMVLSLPSYKSAITGIVERFMGVKGKDSYPTGIAFNLSEQRSFGQVFVYERFLQEHGNSLEKVVAWFFEEYLKTRHGADGFQYKPSSELSTYLEKSRHVFTEMESVIKQFSLYAEDSKIDKELLDLTSDQVRYHDIPSLIKDKYVYATSNEDIALVQFYLFSDQAHLGYIDDSLQASTLFELLSTKNVKFDEFQSFQKPQIDKLVKLGILHTVDSLVKFRSLSQIAALKVLSDYEAIGYNNAAEDIKTEIDSMVNNGWLTRKSTLLTNPEASYFNFQLNQSEFSDGYDLRNKYLHGSQADKDDENAHHNIYIVALKLMVALVIKISNDFYIKDQLDSK